MALLGEDLTLVARLVPSEERLLVTRLEIENAIRGERSSKWFVPDEVVELPGTSTLAISLGDETTKIARLDSLGRLHDKDLIELHLPVNALDDSAIDRLKRFTGLRELECRVWRDNEVGKICEHWPRLEVLRLHAVSEDSILTDEACKAIGQLSRLKAVQLHSARLSDEAFKSLAAIASLESIEVTGTKAVSNGAVESLLKNSKLREVVLWVGPEFTNKGLAQFGKSAHLEHISLFGASRISADAISQLQMALPNCRITVVKDYKLPRFE